MVQAAHIAQPKNTSILATKRSASTAGQRRTEVVALTAPQKSISTVRGRVSVDGADQNPQEADVLTVLQRLMRNSLYRRSYLKINLLGLSQKTVY